MSDLLLPQRFLTIPQVVAKYAPSLIAWKESNHPKIKMDGALDKPMKNWSGGFIKVNEIIISEDSQRVKGIKANYLIDKLKEYKGFLHVKTVLDQIYCPKYNINITLDGMHRAILAWLCNVPEIRRSIVDEHGLDDTDEEMNKRECDYMISKNEEGNQLTKSDLERMRKKTGQLSEENKKVDQLFDSLGISMKDFGAVEEEANFSYDEAITNMKNALTNNTVSYYIGTSKWELYSSKLKDVFDKRSTQKDIMLLSCINVCDSEQLDQFLEYLDSEEFGDIPYDSWTGRCVHSRAIQTACVRLLIRFNEWYRDFEDKNIVRIEQFDRYLNDLPNEAKHCVTSCIVDGKSYDPTLWEVNDEQS